MIDDNMQLQIADWQMVTATRTDRAGTVVTGQLLPYEADMGERVRDNNGQIWPVLAESVRQVVEPQSPRTVEEKHRNMVRALGVTAVACVIALVLGVAIGSLSSSPDPGAFVGLNAGMASRDLRAAGFTSVTYASNGDQVVADPTCTKFTVVDRVVFQDDDHAVLSTHITDEPAMTRWMFQMAVDGTSSSFLASCRRTIGGTG